MAGAVPLLIQAVLLVLVLVAAAYDLRFRRIPNWLVLAGWASGFGLNALLGGWAGLGTAAAGFAAGFGAYFILYLARAMGAGDVKLMGAVGALVGARHWFIIFIASAILGGVVAVCMIAVRGRVKKTLWNVAYIIGEFMRFRAPYMTREELDVKSKKAMTLPHGVMIALGSITWLVLIRLAQ